MDWLAFGLGGGGIALLGALLAARRRATRPGDRLAAIARVSRDLVWSIDSEGRWSFLGEAARDIYGIPAAEMLGRPFTEFAASDHAEQDLAFVENAVAARECVDYETVHETSDHRRVRLAFSAVGHAGGALGTATDITHLRDVESRLVKTERMQAIGALAGGVAHDFKNLLTVVCGQAEIAKRGASEELARRLNAILDAADRGRGMLEELLVFARKENQRQDVIDLNEVVTGMEGVLQRLIGDEIGLVSRLCHQPVYVRADRSKIEQILMNLVVNARDASPAQSLVTVRIDAGRLKEPKTTELGIEPGRWAILQVIDRGEGMTDQVCSQVFEPFYTTKPPRQGTGIGLATVSGIAKQYHGTVVARSAPGRGARMSVLLPLVPEEDHPVTDETTDSVKVPEGA